MKLRCSSRAHRIALLLAAIALSLENSLAAFSPPGQLVVVTDDSYPPYLFRTEGGELQGIIKDKWELWSGKTGIPVKVEGMEWVKAQETLKNKAADVIEALAYTEERARLYEFSAPYAEVDARVFFHRSISGINDVASMRGFTIGAKDGSACASWLEERGIDTIRRFPTSDAVVKAARAREIPLFCMDLPAAQYYIFKQSLEDEFRQTSPLYIAKFHWAVAKGRAELRDFIQRGFERVTARELQDIDTRWLGNPLRFPVSVRYWYYFAVLAATILGLSALLVIWNRTLSVRVSARTAELRKAVGSLEESERRLTKMIEASPEAITIGNVEDGKFIEANPACAQLCGYTREELIGRSPVELGFWPDPNQRVRFIADLQRDHVVHGRELRLRRKGGELRDILASAAIIDLKGRKFILFQAVDITERKNAEKALREHEVMLRELSAHHDSVREGERAHIAREIHDELGQALTALKMDLSVLTIKFGETTPQIRERVQELKGQVDAIIQVVRDVATALRPAALDLGILPGVEWLVEEFQKRSGIRCTVSVAESDIVLGEERSTVLFRIVQESLTNVSRHASAHNVEILLDHDAARIRLDVQDDGVGFDVQAARRKKTFGLLGIQERVIMLRGDLSIDSAPGHGTRVSVSMPIE